MISTVIILLFHVVTRDVVSCGSVCFVLQLKDKTRADDRFTFVVREAVMPCDLRHERQSTADVCRGVCGGFVI